MRLIKPSVELLSVTNNALQLLETAGRVCYKSEDRITATSADPFVSGIIKRGHLSVIEHASATFRIICDRGVTHEIVRHRIASYSQESTRYVNYKGGCQFIIPPWLDIPEGEYNREQDIQITPPANGARVWIRNRFDDEERYNRFIGMGWKPEQARGELPNCTKTEIIMTANFREWLHFLKLRTAPVTHPQMREVANMIMEQFCINTPILIKEGL